MFTENWYTERSYVQTGLENNRYAKRTCIPNMEMCSLFLFCFRLISQSLCCFILAWKHVLARNQRKPQHAPT